VLQTARKLAGLTTLSSRFFSAIYHLPATFPPLSRPGQSRCPARRAAPGTVPVRWQYIRDTQARSTARQPGGHFRTSPCDRLSMRRSTRKWLDGERRFRSEAAAAPCHIIPRHTPTPRARGWVKARRNRWPVKSLIAVLPGASALRGAPRDPCDRAARSLSGGRSGRSEQPFGLVTGGTAAAPPM
jgi:hypothetical protein